MTVHYTFKDLRELAYFLRERAVKMDDAINVKIAESRQRKRREPKGVIVRMETERNTWLLAAEIVLHSAIVPDAREPRNDAKTQLTTIEAIRTWDFVGQSVFDNCACSAIGVFVADESKPVSERAEALRIMYTKAMNLTGAAAGEGAADDLVVKSFLGAMAAGTPLTV